MTGWRDGQSGVEHDPERGFRTPSGRGRPEAPSSLGLLFARWDDPLTWSVRVGSFRGYRVGVHWFTVFWVILQLLMAVPVDRVGPQHVAMCVGSVLLVVFLREAARLAMARSVGGEPEYVVLWPLGALIAPTPPRSAAPKLLITLTPTAVSLVVGVALGVALWLCGATEAQLWFNPFDPRRIASSISTPGMAMLWWASFANIAVAGLNLLPMLPLDGGRLLEAWAWHTRRDRARRLIGVLTLMIAGLVAVVGIVTNQSHLIAIAVFGGWAGWIELRRSEFVEEPAYVSPGLPPDWLVGARPEPPAELPEEDPAEAPQAPEARDLTESAIVDAILAKISASGLGGLTDEERATLARATRRLKGE